MEQKKPNLSYVELVEKLLNEAKKKKEKTKDKKKGHSKEKMADKDYDGDGEVETSKEEYFGSKDKAIKKNMAKKEIVSKKKKKQLDEGRFVGNEQMIYGGFPRIINVVLTEGEYNIPAKVSQSTGGPEEVGMAEFKKLLQSGSHPIMTGQSNQTARGVPPEIRAQALEYIKTLESHPKGAIEGYGKDHPIFKEAMQAHEFFKKHFEQFGVEGQIAELYNLFGK